MTELAGKIAWVTGAGSGIGLAAAKELAAAGAHVVLSGRRREPLDRAVAELEAAGRGAEAAPLDVSDSAAAAATGGLLIERHGRVDILVNCAGTNVRKRWWHELTTEGWDAVIGTNLNGAVYCITAVLPGMRARQDGVIINISSWAGRFSSAISGPAYSTSKHAMVEMSMSINREECRNNIRACCICPAEVATPILLTRPVQPTAEDLARMLKPEDLGSVIRFVATLPAHACINEIVISPTYNRALLGNI